MFVHSPPQLLNIPACCQWWTTLWNNLCKSDEISSYDRLRAAACSHNVPKRLFRSKYPLIFVSSQGQNSASAISPAPQAWSSHRASQINTLTIWSAPIWSSPRLAWTSCSRSWPLIWRTTPCWWERVTASMIGWTCGTACRKVRTDVINKSTRSVI